MDNYSRSAAMVTDMSGTAFTYAFTTLRPVVFFSHNEDTVEEAFDRVKYFQDREKIGYVATSIAELADKMSLALDEKDRFSECIREFRDCEIFNAGRAEEYFAENFRYIAEGIEHADWQYVISPIEACGHEASDKLNETTSESEAVDEPCLVVEGYKGFNIVRFADGYYALAQDEGEFDIGKINRNEYSRCFAGESVNEVKRIIDDPTEQAVQANQGGKRLMQS
jgi:hypothetical protein